MDNGLADNSGGLRFSGSLGRVSVLLLFLVCASLAVAQLDTGTISGTVTDQSGAATPGATITIRNAATGVSRTAATDARGRYEVVALPVGNYEVSAALSGFQAIVRSGINLTVGRHAVVDMVLQVGEVTQAITITGEASRVETTTATVSNLVDEKRVMEIPLNNRDLTQLTYLQPGVLRVPSQGGVGRAHKAGMGDKLSVAGGRPTHNVYLLDGVSNSDVSGNAQGASGAYTGAETVQEFQVITNSYSAEYPSKPGAIVSAVSKSGTNSFHGSLYEFLRNDNLDAARWEDNAIGGGVKPEFKRNHFGGSLGGPVIRDQTFFFGSYEGMRERLTTTETTTVPSVDGRKGNLGNRTVEINPLVTPYLNLYPVPGQANPLTQVPTVLVRELLIPNSTTKNGRALIAGPERNPTNEDFGSVKMDQRFAREKIGFLSVTYNFSDANRNVLGLLPTQDSAGITSRRHVLSARHTSILSPTLLNEFAFGVTNTSPIGNIPSYDIDWGDLVFSPNRTRMGRFGPGDGIGAIGYPSEDSAYKQGLLTFRDSLSLTRAGHTMKMGVEINRIHNLPTFSGGGFNGTYGFDNLASFLEGRPADFEFDLPKGAIVQGQVVREVRSYDLRQHLFGFYFQDNYQMRPSLTWNLGMRYEFMTMPKEANGNLAILKNFMDPTTTVGEFFKNPTLKSFSPRLGFAWSPGNRKTSLRGGAAIYYDHPLLYHWETALSLMVPLNVEGRIQDARLVRPERLRFPDAATTQLHLLAATPNIRSPEYNAKAAQVYRWSLTLDRELGPWFVSAGYTGSRGIHLWTPGEGHHNKWIGWPENPTGPKRWPATGGVPINPAFQNMWIQGPRGSTFYHGLALNVVRRLSAGLQFQGAYTFSKATGVGGVAATRTGDQLPQGQQAAYYWDMHLLRGRSILDIWNNFVSNLTYDLPRTALTGFAGQVLNGWQINGILTLSDGHPFTITDSNRKQRDAMGTIRELRANLIPGGNNDPVLGGPDMYYDVTQFVPSVCFGSTVCREGDPDYQVGYYGNLGFNTLTAPGVATFDFSLNKNFQLTEENRLQFRAEFFNLFNRPNFGLPATGAFESSGTLNSLAGQITETRTSAREIQFGLKFIF